MRQWKPWWRSRTRPANRPLPQRPLWVPEAPECATRRLTRGRLRRIRRSFRGLQRSERQVPGGCRHQHVRGHGSPAPWAKGRRALHSVGSCRGAHEVGRSHAPGRRVRSRRAAQPICCDEFFEGSQALCGTHLGEADETRTCDRVLPVSRPTPLAPEPLLHLCDGPAGVQVAQEPEGHGRSGTFGAHEGGDGREEPRDGQEARLQVTRLVRFEGRA